VGEDDGLGWPTHIPLIPVAEALGSEVNWNTNTRRVTLEGLNGEISFIVGSNDFEVDGETFTMNQSSEEIDGELYVPILFFRNIFGAGSAIFSGGIVEINTEDAGDMF